MHQDPFGQTLNDYYFYLKILVENSKIQLFLELVIHETKTLSFIV
jgi:hypothetical protein